MNPNKKSSPASARGLPPPFNRQAESAHPFKPMVAQLKTRMAAPSVKHPIAPPVYRPQQAPKVLQTKNATGQSPQAGQAPRQPIAPPVYRPQQPPKVLQTKSSLSPGPSAAQARKSPTAPPVYRPEQKRIAQPKMAVSAPMRTLPKGSPVYRPEANKLVQPKAMSGLGKPPTAPPAYRPKQNRLAQPIKALGVSTRIQLTAGPVRRAGTRTGVSPGQGVVQRVLAVTNLEKKSEASQSLVDFINHTIFQGKYVLDLVPTEDYHVLRLREGVDKEIELSGERFYTMLEKMITSQRIAFVRLTEGNPNFSIASFDNQAIDVRDISAFGGPNMRGVNAAGVLIHELWEQYNAQVNQLSYERAHAEGITAENWVQRSDRIFDYARRVSDAPLEQEREDARVDLYPDGQIVLSRIYIADNAVKLVRRMDVTERIIQYLERNQVKANDLKTALETIVRTSSSELIKLCELAIKSAE